MCSVPCVAMATIPLLMQVKNRINHKTPVVRKLDVKIREIGRDLGVRFGGEELSYDFLTDSLEYFTKVKSHDSCFWCYFNFTHSVSLTTQPCLRSCKKRC